MRLDKRSKNKEKKTIKIIPNAQNELKEKGR